MKNNKNNDKTGPVIDISSLPTGGLPETSFEMVNNYGTYNIQATADTDNMYPAIAQGFNEGIINLDCENKDAPLIKKQENKNCNTKT